MSLPRIGLILILLVAAVAVVYAIYQALDERSGPPILIQDAAADVPVVVEVRGAVNTPGVYELSPGARLQGAIAAAGGLTDEADLSTVNLARRLRDGELVTVLALPSLGSTPAAPISGADHAVPATGPQGRININTATAEELEALPEIGEVTAARIIAYREQNGPFRSVDDLINVEGVSLRTIDQFRELVTTAP